jgi:hypothetical protein
MKGVLLAGMLCLAILPLHGQTLPAEGDIAVDMQPAEVAHVVSDDLLAAQDKIHQQEIVIARLSKHLESALGRLNGRPSAVAADPKLASLMAERLRLQQENAKLEAQNKALAGQMAELNKKTQLIDLENRQLFAAINSAPRSDAPIAEQTGKKPESPLADRR